MRTMIYKSMKENLKGKKEEILTYETARINLENTMPSETNQVQMTDMYDSTNVRYLK